MFFIRNLFTSLVLFPYFSSPFFFLFVYNFSFCSNVDSIIVSRIFFLGCKYVLANSVIFWTIFPNMLEALKSKFCVFFKPKENSTFQSTRGCDSDRRGRCEFMNANYPDCLVVLCLSVYPCVSKLGLSDSVFLRAYLGFSIPCAFNPSICLHVCVLIRMA